MAKAVTKKEIQAMTGLSSSAVNNHVKRYPEVFEVVGKTGKATTYKASSVKKHFKGWSKTSAAKTAKRKPKSTNKKVAKASKVTTIKTEMVELTFEKSWVTFRSSSALNKGIHRFYWQDITGVSFALKDDEIKDDYFGMAILTRAGEHRVKLSYNSNENMHKIYDAFEYWLTKK